MLKQKLLIFSLLVTFIIAVYLSLAGTRTKNNNKSLTIVNSKKCPTNYVMVPGDPKLSTTDFCVMKYVAKCTNPSPNCVTNQGVYKNNKIGCECRDNFRIESKSDGAPITYIPEDDGSVDSAKVYCKNIGQHLITQPEWLTIARNVEQVNNNWCNKDGTSCGNPPGSAGKILANGHNDSVPNKALESGADDKPCFGTTSDDSGMCGSKSSQKRTLQLSNGEIIWDLAGNVWQWVDITIQRKDEPLSKNPANKYSAWTWEEFTDVDYDPSYMPSNSNWNSKQGVGRVFHYSYFGDTDPTIYTYINGGNWRHGQDSGAFTVHMQPVPGKKGIDDIGFRCVTSPVN